MSEITRNLSYNDIKMLKRNVSGRGKKIEERESQELEQDRQRERQD